MLIVRIRISKPCVLAVNQAIEGSAPIVFKPEIIHVTLFM